MSPKTPAKKSKSAPSAAAGADAAVESANSSATSASAAAAAAVDALLQSRGSATPQELQASDQDVLNIARNRPELEPVFMVRFRSRQNKVRVQEVRAFAWPSEKIALRHLGYRAEQAKLLRLEPRQRVPFPARLYATFEKKPKELEALRLAEKAYQKAMKQAPSKPGRAERDVVPLQSAFKQLGDDIAMEMWIEAASVFQALDNATYASKMLGNLLKLVSKDKKIDASLLARTVLSAADDGVFNSHLYEFTWEMLEKKLSTQVALGFGLRVFRRLIASGRKLPGDFTKDMRRAADKGKVKNFEPLFDSNILWATGQSSFWNTAKNAPRWSDEATQDHAETNLLRARFRELWIRASSPESGAEGEPWKSKLWERIRSLMPELSSYGRTVLVENLLNANPSSRADAERLLEAALAMSTRSPSPNDRERVELAADGAFFKIAELDANLVWDRSAALEEALRTNGSNLTSFVSLYDLLCDLSESLPPRSITPGAPPVTVIRSLPGLLPAWTGALVEAFPPPKPEDKSKKEDDDYYDDDDEEDDSGATSKVGALGEALALMTPETAGESLAELGPGLALALAGDLSSDSDLEAWSWVLGSLRQLGPVGVGITNKATETFIKNSGSSEQFGNAARLAHFLDGEALKKSAEARGVVEDALKQMLESVSPAPKTEKLVRPEKELGENPKLLDVIQLEDGTTSLLWAKRPENEYDDNPYKAVAVTHISKSGEQKVAIQADLKGADLARQWLTSKGQRFIVLKDKTALLYGEEFDKPIAKLAFGDEYSGDTEIHISGQFALILWHDKKVLVDVDFKTIGELEETGYGSWHLLNGHNGAPPSLFFSSGNEVSAVYAEPNKPLPAFKAGDNVDSIDRAFRTDDGAFCFDYVTNKQKRKRAHFDAATNHWVVTDGSKLPERPVVAVVSLSGGDFVQLGKSSEPLIVSGGDNIIELKDLLGQTKAVCAQRPGDTLVAFEPSTGTSYFAEERWIDPSAPIRLKLFEATRALMNNAEEQPLGRAAYTDTEKLTDHLLARIGARPGAAEVLKELGEYARPWVLAAAKALSEVQKARAKVLDALAQPVPPKRSVPPRKSGVRRTAIRRVVRTHLNSNTLVFWALDGCTPGPVIDSLFRADGSVDPSAMGMALTLLSIAQQPKTDAVLAERALELCEAIVSKFEQPEWQYKIDPADPEEIDDDGIYWDDDGAVSVRSIDSLGDVLLWRPSGTFPKKSPPVPLPEDSTKRREALREWLEKKVFQALSPQRIETLVEKGVTCQYRCHVRVNDTDFGIDVLLHQDDDGFHWKVTGVNGKANAATWKQLFASMTQALEPLPTNNSTVVWPGANIAHPDDIAGLRQGIALTRARMADRASLDFDSWQAPEIKGLNANESRWVMLAWLLDQIDPKSAGTTKPVFDKIAKSCKFVAGNYYGLVPKKGTKTGDEFKRSPEFAQALRLGMLRLEQGRWNDRALPTVVLLAEPSVLVQAYAKEVGL
jgi:hypothetical protein